jgi:tetratricopeptide (TPR) repeat protein
MVIDMLTNPSVAECKKPDVSGNITATSLGQSRRPTARLDEARVLHEISIKALDDRQPEKARRFARRALAILERDHGDSREIARVLLSLAAACHDSGDYSRAEMNFLRADDLLRNMSENDGYLETQRLRIAGTRGLAGVARALGRDAEAETLLEASLLSAERVFGRRHAVVALVLDDLGVLHRETGRFDEAFSLHRRALAIVNQTLGAAHPQASGTLHNLATLAVAAGDIQRAEPFARQCLTIREQTIGPDHPRAGTAASSLASILVALGREDEAERLYRRAISIFERWFGSGHETVLLTVNSLADPVRVRRRAPAATRQIGVSLR